MGEERMVSNLAQDARRSGGGRVVSTGEIELLLFEGGR